MTDAASRGFLVLPCHLARRCIARIPSVSVSFDYTLNFDLLTDAASRGFPVLARHLATPYDPRCIVWFPSNFVKSQPILKILSLSDSAGNLL